MTKLTKEQVKFFIETMTDDMHNTTQHKIAETLLSKFGECESLQEKLLAYEQAAKNPAAKIEWDGSEFSVNNVSGEFYYGTTDVYLAPVLPKQPDVTLTDEGETAKIVKAAEKLVRCKGRYHSEQNYRALAALFGVTVPDLPPLPTDEEPAQPVIPEEKSAIHRTKEPEDIAFNNGFAAGWNCCRSEVISLNETTAQPVSEPYKLPHDWIERQFAYQNLFNAIAAVVSKHPNIEISIKALDNSRLAAAPAQEHE